MGKGSKPRPVIKSVYDNNFDSIFGAKPPVYMRYIEPGKVKKTVMSPQDQRKHKDWVKIGKEVCRMSKLGEKHKHKELDKDCKKLMDKPKNKQLSHEITRDFYKALKGY